jgi:hypothetical protein
MEYCSAKRPAKQNQDHAMKTLKFTGLGLLVSFSLVAAPMIGVDKVQFRDNKVFAWQNGAVVAAITEVALPFEILVQTNGVFTVKGGKERRLGEGEILGHDGMLLKPDGSILAVMDHVTMNRGQVLRSEDGEAAAPRDSIQLGDGTTLRPDRKIITPHGTASWLLDGELLQPEGGSLPARDTITMQNGRMMVQKDGSMLALDPARSITMNDGTKVMGDGTIISFQGERTTKLTEGQVFVIEGVVVRRR